MSLTYLAKRILLLFLVLWAAATINFVLPRIAPRNPVRERIIEMATSGGYVEAGIEEMVAAYEEKFGMDQPLWQQYLRYLGDMARLDFGYSLANYPRTVRAMIGEALPWTIGLVFSSMIIAFAVGNLLGALIAWPHAPDWLEYSVVPLMTISAVPHYLFGLILIYFLGFRIDLFPTRGGYGIGTVPSRDLSFYLEILYHSFLPALAMILTGLGGNALGMRGMMVTTQGEDYMILAEAKGLRNKRRFFRYGIRNALLPQVTSLALSLGFVFSGSVLVETVFAYPGLGNMLAQSIYQFDYPVIYGIVFMIIFVIGISMFVLDLILPLMDPRIAYEGE